MLKWFRLHHVSGPLFNNPGHLSAEPGSDFTVRLTLQVASVWFPGPGPVVTVNGFLSDAALWNSPRLLTDTHTKTQPWFSADGTGRRRRFAARVEQRSRLEIWHFSYFTLSKKFKRFLRLKWVVSHGSSLLWDQTLWMIRQLVHSDSTPDTEKNQREKSN